ncbi:hypothetical protein LDENG_00184730 [Lucifuga dentata]|nr:hypothetical protein LDENG_00184730 [Lucifuga dentata]
MLTVSSEMQLGHEGYQSDRPGQSPIHIPITSLIRYLEMQITESEIEKLYSVKSWLTVYSSTCCNTAAISSFILS